MMRYLAAALVCMIGGCSQTNNSHHGDTGAIDMSRNGLGAFSVSLAVKDLKASRAFYEKLGFTQVGGDGGTWIILRSGTTTIGLFEGMLEKNTLTFNPGWDWQCNTLPEFDDVREIQRALKKKGVTLTAEADKATTGPAFIMLADPDGNPILLDQHVPSPKK